MNNMLLILTACLHDIPAYEPSAPPPELVEVFDRQEQARVYDEALARRGDGDLVGAEHRLTWLIDVGGDPAEMHYQLGIVHELQGEYEDAVSAYTAALESDGSRSVDARYRRALCLDELGRWKDSVREYRKLPRSVDYDRADWISIEMAQGVAELRAGNARRGAEMLDRAMRATDETEEMRWLRARTAFHLAEMELSAVEDLRLDTRKPGKNLGRRAAALQNAEAHIVDVVKTGEPEWMLRAMLELGDAYADLHADMLATAPDDLEGEALELYYELLEQQTAVLKAKAYMSYDQGLVVASKFQLYNDTTEQLQRRRDAIDL